MRKPEQSFLEENLWDFEELLPSKNIEIFGGQVQVIQHLIEFEFKKILLNRYLILHFQLVLEMKSLKM